MQNYSEFKEICKNAQLTAVYPASIELEPEPGKRVNVISNLKQFIDDLAKSFRSVLSGEKKAVLIRIAHVGATISNSIVIDNQLVIGKCGDGYNCLFVPIPGDVSTCLLYLVDRKELRRLYILKDQQKEPIKLPIDLHADPLIYALKEEGGETKFILSLTYGEDDAEPRHIWYNFVKEREWSTNNIDAYVLFNSTFIIQDGIDIQLIHGGFKAVMWNPLSCFKASTPPEYCLQFPQVDEHLRSRILERVQVNPHWIRGDYKDENVKKDDYILMIVGDESSWFFSLPIAPPPLYFLAQWKENKINLSRNIIRSRLGRDEEEVRKRVSEVLETYGLNDIPVDMRQLLGRFMVESYYRGEASDFVKAFRNKVEKIMEEYHNEFYDKYRNGCCSKEYKDELDIKQCAKDYLARCHIVPDLIQKFHATPQYRPTYEDGRIVRYGNYSYLDLVISKKDYENCMRCMECISDSGETYRCSIAWVFGLSLLVLLDSYVRFVEEQARS